MAKLQDTPKRTHSTASRPQRNFVSGLIDLGRNDPFDGVARPVAGLGRCVVQTLAATIGYNQLPPIVGITASVSAGSQASQFEMIDKIIGDATRWFKTVADIYGLPAEKVKFLDPVETQLRNEEYLIRLRFDYDRDNVAEWLKSEIAANKPRAVEYVPEKRVDQLTSFREAIDRAIECLPEDYKFRHKALVELGDVARERIAAALAPALNQQVATMPQTSYEDKKKLARWINAELRPVGLAIRCPKTGEPSWIIANVGHRADVGRFHFEHMDAEGKRQRTVTSNTLPILELMLDKLTRVPYGERAQRGR
jgi:hypothetical protein